MSKLTNFETIITMAGKEIAVGRELKYFWNNSNVTITKHRNNLKRTLIELHLKKRLSDKVTTEEGDYQVREYTVPNVDWIKKFVNYSHRVYLTAVGNIDELYVDVATRDCYLEGEQKVPKPKDGDMYATLFDSAEQGKVLSPDSFKQVLKQVSQYNKEWETTVEISKHAVDFATIHGFFTTDENPRYYVTNRDGDRVLSQMLGLTTNDFKNYGVGSDVLSDDALVRLMVSSKTDKKTEKDPE